LIEDFLFRLRRGEGFFSECALNRFSPGENLFSAHSENFFFLAQRKKSPKAHFFPKTQKGEIGVVDLPLVFLKRVRSARYYSIDDDCVRIFCVPFAVFDFLKANLMPKMNLLLFSNHLRLRRKGYFILNRFFSERPRALRKTAIQNIFSLRRSRIK
jgi:hypothetical protein